MERGNSVRNIALLIGLPRAAIDRALGRVPVACDFFEQRCRFAPLAVDHQAIRLRIDGLRIRQRRCRKQQHHDQQERHDAFEMSRHVRSSFQNYSYTNYNMIYL